MIRDLEYPDDARRLIDSLHKGLRYDAAVAVLGNACAELQSTSGAPGVTTGFFRCSGEEEDRAVRRDAPGLLSRFSMISMVSRFEVHLNLLLLQRRVLEELRRPGKRMTPTAMWGILKTVHRQSRDGPVKVCAEQVLKEPSPELLSRLNWLDGIYKVRNCLAHRLGAVQLHDVKPRDVPLERVKDTDVLRVVWLRPRLFINGVEVTELPFYVKDGGDASVRFDEYIREWKVGEQIDVTPSDCQCVSMSLALLANQVLVDFETEMNSLLRQTAAE